MSASPWLLWFALFFALFAGFLCVVFHLSPIDKPTIFLPSAILVGQWIGWSLR